MRRLAVLAALLGVLAGGCASFNLPEDATPGEKAAARCLDARTSLAVAEAVLAGNLQTTEVVYWQSFAAGCRIAVEAYCGAQVGCIHPPESYRPKKWPVFGGYWDMGRAEIVEIKANLARFFPAEVTQRNA